MMYKIFIRPFLFLLSAEQAHNLVLSFLRIHIFSRFLKFLNFYEHPSLKRDLFGLTFKNPVGLAAGFDKNGSYICELGSLGFGFIEIGTVTPKPQKGNEKPRLFRLLKDKVIINRMGFNNCGVEEVLEKLKGRNSDILIGVNIGKNKDTPNEKAGEDYVHCFKKLYDYVDYFVVNISSPNTPNLRELQKKKPLEQLMSALQKENRKNGITKPILIKISPDLSEIELEELLEVVQKENLDGIIVANTTVSREGLKTSSKKLVRFSEGGLSGKPLFNRSTELIRLVAKKAKGLPVIGVGGIHSPEDALEKLKAGASLVQIYTGIVYEGPQLVKKIKKKFVKAQKEIL